MKPPYRTHVYEKSGAWFIAFLVAVALLAGPAAAHGAELEVDFPNSGHGRVTSDVGGLNCPPTCTVPVPDDSTVTLTATPAKDYVLGRANQQGLPEDDSGWEGCEEVPGDRSRCTVEVQDGTTFVDASFRPAALLLVVANGGNGAIRAQISNPEDGEIDDQTCQSARDGGKVCPYAYVPGRVVTLTALPSDDPGSVPFLHWSDDDCGAALTCAVVLDEPRTSVTGTYGTQHVFVQVWGPGRVTSTPAGIDCTVIEADGFDECNTVVETGQDVALTAEGVNPQWVTDPAPERAGCDFTTGAGTVCHVAAERSRWTVVSFADVPAQDQYPPKAGVNFKVRKAGDGRGTVRGGGIDCGSRCNVEASFGDRVVLSADAAGGSRFVRWRGGCGERARCELTVGPTTRVTAVFARVATVATVQPEPKVEKLRAALQPVRVKRVRGRRYRIVMPLRLNLAAKVTARVMSRRGRRLVRRTWKSPAGNRRLVLRVRARSGRYRLVVRIQTADGQVRRITRTLRLR